MFCMKCGKKLENPGICCWCGADNGICSENNYFKSPEIEFLLQDDEDFQFMKVNTVLYENSQQNHEPAVHQSDVNSDSADMNIDPAMSARESVSAVPSVPKSGEPETGKIPVQDTVTAAKPAESESLQAEESFVCAASSCKGYPEHAESKKTHGSLKVGRIVGLIIAVLFFGILISILCSKCSKNKDNKKENSLVSDMSEIIIESSYDSTLPGKGSSVTSAETTEITTGTEDEKTNLFDEFNEELEEIYENVSKITENKDDTQGGEQYYQ